MTVNIELLIRNIGNSYSNIVNAGLIPYKTQPSSSSGEPTVHLNMAKEGIFLSFKREGRLLEEIDLTIQNQNVKNWTFPNELPAPLQKLMPRTWVHNTFGSPDKSIAPTVVMKMEIGWVERFTLEGFHIPITMIIQYDMGDMAESITFLPTSKLRW